LPSANPLLPEVLATRSCRRLQARRRPHLRHLVHIPSAGVLPASGLCRGLLATIFRGKAFPPRAGTTSTCASSS